MQGRSSQQLSPRCEPARRLYEATKRLLFLSPPHKNSSLPPHLLWLLHSSCSSFKNLLLLLLHPSSNRLPLDHKSRSRAGCSPREVGKNRQPAADERHTHHSLSLSAHKKLFRKSCFLRREWSHLQQKAISDTFSFLCQIHYLSFSRLHTVSRLFLKSDAGF